MTLEIRGQIFTSLRAQIVHFLLLACIRWYIYNACRVFTLNFMLTLCICDTPECRRNISIGIPLDLSIPTEMTSIAPLVENENSSKTPKKFKIMLCYIFSD